MTPRGVPRATEFAWLFRFHASTHSYEQEIHTISIMASWKNTPVSSIVDTKKYAASPHVADFATMVTEFLILQINLYCQSWRSPLCCVEGLCQPSCADSYAQTIEQTLSTHNLQSLPVYEHDKCIGLIDLADIVAFLVFCCAIVSNPAKCLFCRSICSTKKLELRALAAQTIPCKNSPKKPSIVKTSATLRRVFPELFFFFFNNTFNSF